MLCQLSQDCIFIKGPRLSLPVIYTNISVYTTRHMAYKICIELFASCPCFAIFIVASISQMILPLKRDRRVLSKELIF
jgi:hypothetical protein